MAYAFTKITLRSTINVARSLNNTYLSSLRFLLYNGYHCRVRWRFYVVCFIHRKTRPAARFLINMLTFNESAIILCKIYNQLHRKYFHAQICNTKNISWENLRSTKLLFYVPLPLDPNIIKPNLKKQNLSLSFSSLARTTDPNQR